MLNTINQILNTRDNIHDSNGGIENAIENMVIVINIIYEKADEIVNMGNEDNERIVNFMI